MMLKKVRKLAKPCAAAIAAVLAAMPGSSSVEPPEPVVETPTSKNTEVCDNIADLLSFSDEELDILYRIAWAEARGEDDIGIILVINVVMNRVNDRQFPGTIREVVFAPRQFSPVWNGAFDRAKPDQRIKDAVHRALRGEDFSHGALYFRTVCERVCTQCTQQFTCVNEHECNSCSNSRGAEGSWHETALTALFDHGAHRFYI